MDYLCFTTSGTIGLVFHYTVIKYCVYMFYGVSSSIVIVNSIGSFLAGVFLFLFSEKIISENLFTAFCGFLVGLTTFSSFSRNLLQLYLNKDFFILILYMIFAPVSGFLLVLIGWILAKKCF